MKFCLHNRVSAIYLQKADEIAIFYRDRNAATDYFEKYPDKSFVIEFPEPITIDEVETVNDYAKYVKLSVKLGYYSPWCKDLKVPWFLGYPIESFSEARALINNGVQSLRLGSPLFFQMNKVKELNASLRLVPNQCWYSPVPRENGICGLWIRPEDIRLYDQFSDNVTIEFEADRATEEEALYRIYAEEHEWPGPMNMIFKNFNTDGENRMIHPDLSSMRLNCGHKCMETGNCHTCSNIIKLQKKLLQANYTFQDGILSFKED